MSTNPNPMIVGQSNSVTLSGQHFGTNPPTVTLSLGGSVTLSGTPSDTTINATVVPSTAGTGTFSVTAAGYGGNGFRPEPGQSPGSAPSQIVSAVNPTLQLSYNGQAVTANSTVYITPAPSLPLLASLKPQPLTGNVSWTLQVSYSSPGSYLYACTVTGSTSASSSFDINAAFASKPSYYCGGAATLSYSVEGSSGSIPFTILGQSPAASTVKATLGGNPWYILQLANSESPGYLQFQSSGYPVFGAPNGYGIMQIDFANTAADLWTWTSNVADGKSVISSSAAASSTWWKNQVGAWNLYNQRNPSGYVPPPTDSSEGPCTFSANPAGAMHPFTDALGIKAYNSGPPTASAAYIQFSSTLGAWVLAQFNSSGFDYVYRVCSASPN